MNESRKISSFVGRLQQTRAAPPVRDVRRPGDRAYEGQHGAD